MHARRTYLFALIGLLAACAQEADDGGSGADGDLQGGVGPGAGAGGSIDPSASQLMYFTLGGSAYVATAAGTTPQKICDGSEVLPSGNGQRALCIPVDGDQPLVLHDTQSGMQTPIPGWNADAIHGPKISPDGNLVAFGALNDDFDDVVRIHDAGGNMVGEIANYFGVVDFLGPTAVLLDEGIGTPRLWQIGADDPLSFNGTNFQGTGPNPEGVVFEVNNPRFIVRFVGLDGMPRDLGDGRLGGVYGRRVLITPGAAGGAATLVDLSDPTYKTERELPTPRFDEQVNYQLTGPRSMVARYETLANCANNPTSRASVRTVWRHIEDGDEVEIANTAPDTHLALVDAVGVRAAVLQVDACQVPTGRGFVVTLGGESIPFQPDLTTEQVKTAAVSPDGNFVALGTVTGLWVVDLRTTPTPRIAQTGGEVTSLFFR